MNLSDTIRRGVELHAPFHDHVEQVLASQGGVTVRCSVSGAERLGCALTELELIEPGAAPLTMAELDERVERICAKVTYLLEPLRKIELDANAKVALVRSREPKHLLVARPDADAPAIEHVAYYELLAQANRRVTLQRYRFVPTNRKRAPTEILLTNEQLALLVEDLLAATSRARN